MSEIEVKKLDKKKTWRYSKTWGALQKLLQRGIQKSTNRPLLWAGAGFSVGAGYPTTSQLIEKLRECSLDDDLPNFDPSNIYYRKNSPERSFTHWIQSFVQANGYGELTDALTSIFQKSHAPQPMHQDVVSLPWKAIFTTNYDDLIERSLHQEKLDFSLITLEDNLSSRSSSLPLLKIHGSVTDFKRLILDEESYQKYTSQYPFLLEKLKLELLENSIIYLGSSMLDPRLLDWFQECVSNGKASHLKFSVAILRLADWKSIPPDEKELIEKCQVHPLLFKNFGDLPVILAELRNHIYPLNTDVPKLNASK